MEGREGSRSRIPGDQLETEVGVSFPGHCWPGLLREPTSRLFPLLENCSAGEGAQDNLCAFNSRRCFVEHCENGTLRRRCSNCFHAFGTGPNLPLSRRSKPSNLHRKGAEDAKRR